MESVTFVIAMAAGMLLTKQIQKRVRTSVA
jgi:hypothetical protein